MRNFYSILCDFTQTVSDKKKVLTRNYVIINSVRLVFKVLIRTFTKNRRISMEEEKTRFCVIFFLNFSLSYTIDCLSGKEFLTVVFLSYEMAWTIVNQQTANAFIVSWIFDKARRHWLQKRKKTRNYKTFPSLKSEGCFSFCIFTEVFSLHLRDFLVQLLISEGSKTKWPLKKGNPTFTQGKTNYVAKF